MTQFTKTLRFLASRSASAEPHCLRYQPELGYLGRRPQTAVWSACYEYPEFHQPDVSDAQAMKIALSRCSGWGL
jgi:hypothetical protein